MKTRTNQPIYLDNGQQVDDNNLGGGTKIYIHHIRFVLENDVVLDLELYSTLNASFEGGYVVQLLQDYINGDNSNKFLRVDYVNPECKAPATIYATSSNATILFIDESGTILTYSFDSEVTIETDIISVLGE